MNRRDFLASLCAFIGFPSANLPVLPIAEPILKATITFEPAVQMMDIETLSDICAREILFEIDKEILRDLNVNRI